MAKKGSKGAKAGSDAPANNAGRSSRSSPDIPTDAPTLDPDTVMMIVDPATKVKMPVLFSQTEPTNGRIAFIRNQGTKKDSYLCMLYQRGRCKSHGMCNQIHADRQLVAKAREGHAREHGETVADEPLSNQRGVEVVVVDPTNKQSRVSVPLLQTRDTLGRRNFLKAVKEDGTFGDVEVCRVYVNAVATAAVPPTPNGSSLPTPQCKHGDRCPHVHMDLPLLKFLLEPGKPCCQFHGTEHTVDYKGKVFMINKSNQRCPLPLDRLMTTKGLRGLMTSQSSLAFSCNRVCRLHQEKRCQWGRECSNLHICREFYSVYSTCSQPSRTSMPSYRGLQILANGKLKPVVGKKGLGGKGCGAADMNGVDMPAAMAAMPPPHISAAIPGFGMPMPHGMPPPMQPFMQPPMPRQPESVMGSVVGLGETFGIPLVTDEGPVQKRLLPEEIRRKIADIPSLAALAPVTGSALTKPGKRAGGMNQPPQPAGGMNMAYPPHPMAQKEVPAALQDVDEVGSEPCTPPLSPQVVPNQPNGHGSGPLPHTRSSQSFTQVHSSGTLGQPTYSSGPPQLGNVSGLHATSSGASLPPPLYTPIASGVNLGNGEHSPTFNAFNAGGGPVPPFPMNNQYNASAGSLPHTWSEVGRKHAAGRPPQHLSDVSGAPPNDPYELSKPVDSFTNNPYSLHTSMTPTTSSVRAAC